MLSKPRDLLDMRDRCIETLYRAERVVDRDGGKTRYKKRNGKRVTNMRYIDAHAKCDPVLDITYMLQHERDETE